MDIGSIRTAPSEDYIDGSMRAILAPTDDSSSGLCDLSICTHPTGQESKLYTRRKALSPYVDTRRLSIARSTPVSPPSSNEEIRRRTDHVGGDSRSDENAPPKSPPADLSGFVCEVAPIVSGSATGVTVAGPADSDAGPGDTAIADPDISSPGRGTHESE